MRPPPDGEVDDRALLTAHLEGDTEAFGQLFGRHRDRLWAVALRTTGDPEEAADALQDGLVSAFRRAESYRGDAAVTTWLHRIVVNACLDRLRRRKIRAADPLPDDLDEYGSLNGSLTTNVSGDSDPEVTVLGDERRRAVLRALDTLPPEQKAALVLVDMEGYSVEETAVILECAPGTIKSRCSRGRAKLAPLLSGLRDSEPRVDLARPNHGPGSQGPGRPAPDSAAPDSPLAEEVTHRDPQGR